MIQNIPRIEEAEECASNLKPSDEAAIWRWFGGIDGSCPRAFEIAKRTKERWKAERVFVAFA